MIEAALYYIHYFLLLIFGVLLTFAFSGVKITTRKNMIVIATDILFCGLLQLVIYFVFGETVVWQLYPFITHLPSILLLLFGYKKRMITAVTAMTSAYLCCQPAKWIGVLFAAMTGSYRCELLARIVTLLLAGYVALVYMSAHLSKLFTKDTRSVAIFGCVPIVYYIFDYIMGIYTSLWLENNRVATEFLPFMLCISFMMFCFVYYKEYEQKAEAEQKEQLIRITAQQQAKEIENTKRSMHEIVLIRHDIRLMLAVWLSVLKREIAKRQLRSSPLTVIISTAPKWSAIVR